MTIAALPLAVTFQPGEVVQISASYKYADADPQSVSQGAELQLARQWWDEQRWYSVNLLRVG